MMMGSSVSQWSPGMPRPQSAERRRWHARLSLLQGSGDAKVNQVAKRDEEELGQLMDSSSRSKYIHLEYLLWMGPDIPDGVIDEGDVVCPSCQRVLGSWAWNPHPRHTLQGRLEAPVIRILRSVVVEADLVMDATPITTPRLDSDGSASSTPRSARSMSVENK